MTEKRGKWITVRPDDPRIKKGDRIKLKDSEGKAWVGTEILIAEDAVAVEIWSVRRGSASPEIELWAEVEVLPLPEPGIPFWGEWRGRAAPDNRHVHTGWLVVDDDGDARRLDNNYWTDAVRVTRLPIPPEEMEKLK